LTPGELDRTVTVDSEAAFDPGGVWRAVCQLLVARVAADVRKG
jgi:hypothetical protein